MSEPTAYELERMALGELPTPPEHADAVAKLRTSNAEILAQYAPRDVVPKIEAATPARSPMRWVPAAALALVAIAIVVFAWPGNMPDRAPQRLVPGTDGAERIKGPALRLQVWRMTGRDQQLLEDGDTVSAGDLVQAKFGTSTTGYGTVFTVDGRKKVTLLHPTAPDGETRIEPGALRPTSFAYELDDAPDFERVFFVVCDAPIDVRALTDRVAAGEPAGDECSAETVELVKQ